MLTRLYSIAWRSGAIPLDWQTRVDQTPEPPSTWGGHTLQPLWEGLCQTTGKYNLSVSRTSDTSVLWDTGPALSPLKEIWGCVGFCPTSLHVFFGLGEGIWPQCFVSMGSVAHCYKLFVPYTTIWGAWSTLLEISPTHQQSSTLTYSHKLCVVTERTRSHI